MEIKDSDYYIKKLEQMSVKFKLSDGSILDVSPKSNIALFAYGATGIFKWKQKRKELGVTYKDFSEENSNE